jgi:tetratricopeptide (TPR) repeat protein
MRVRLVHGLGFVQILRAEYNEALATVDRAEALDADCAHQSLRVVAATLRGHVYMMQGRPQESRDSFERALVALESGGLDPAEVFIADPQVTSLAALSVQLTHIGLTAQARARMEQAYARARRIGQPMALMVAIWFDALRLIRLGDAQLVGRLADEMRRLVEEFSLAQGAAAHRFFRGWADVQDGNLADGLRSIREGYDQNRALGMICGSSETLGYAAEALLLEGDRRGARELLEQAQAMVDSYGERVYLPQLLLIEGAIARANGGRGAADAVIRRAVQEAREQGAAWLELLALIVLCEQAGAAEEDRCALATLVGQLAEASETTAVARARALLTRA